MRIRQVAILLLVVSAGFVSGALWRDYRCFLVTPIHGPDAGVFLEIAKGTRLRQLADQMAQQGILEHPYYFLLLAYLQGDQSRIKAGEYELTRDMTPPQVLARLTSGRVVEYSITLVEGRTFRQALAVIDAHGTFGGESLASLSDAQLMERLGRPGEHPEGRFFPDTYRFPRQTRGMEILTRAMERMDRVLAEEWEERAPNLPIQTPQEALVLASIIEKETAVPAERPRIGGVFVQRLRKGMKLQTDPTVIYGLGERFDGNIRLADLRESTPYNTYVIAGLPPTPIALPGREAIRAALRPEEGDALYFVAKGDGSHVFSKTLDEHNEAVRRYILKKGE